MVILWVLTRGFVVLLAFDRNLTTGDVLYYYRQAQRHSLTDGLVEYPFPMAVALMAPAKVLPWSAYSFSFAALALAVDAALAYACYRAFGREAAWRWVWLLALIGPLAYYRFDIYVTASLTVYLLAVRRHPGVAGTAVASGFGVKLWPAIFGLGFVGQLRQRLRQMIVALAGGVAVLAVTAAVAGIDRIFSPLKWQGSRGFQTEALLSSGIGLGQLFGHSARLAKQHGSWEYVGPELAEWTWVVQALSKAGYVLVFALIVVVMLCSHNAQMSPSEMADDISDGDGPLSAKTRELEVLAVGMTAVVGTFIVTSPVISPQYLLWLIPGLVLVPIRSVRYLGYAVMALSQLNAPVLFMQLFSTDYWDAAAYRLTVFTRNVLLLVLVVLTIRWLLQRLPSRR